MKKGRYNIFEKKATGLVEGSEPIKNKSKHLGPLGGGKGDQGDKVPRGCQGMGVSRPRKQVGCRRCQRPFSRSSA